MCQFWSHPVEFLDSGIYFRPVVYHELPLNVETWFYAQITPAQTHCQNDHLSPLRDEVTLSGKILKYQLILCV